MSKGPGLARESGCGEGREAAQGQGNPERGCLNFARTSRDRGGMFVRFMLEAKHWCKMCWTPGREDTE